MLKILVDPRSRILRSSLTYFGIFFLETCQFMAMQFMAMFFKIFYSILFSLFAYMPHM